MKKITKNASDLQSGDRIVDRHAFPPSLYSGVVRSTEVVDDDVRIILTDGEFTRPPWHPLEVEA